MDRNILSAELAAAGVPVCSLSLTRSAMTFFPKWARIMRALIEVTGEVAVAVISPGRPLPKELELLGSSKLGFFLGGTCVQALGSFGVAE